MVTKVDCELRCEHLSSSYHCCHDEIVDKDNHNLFIHDELLNYTSI